MKIKKSIQDMFLAKMFQNQILKKQTFCESLPSFHFKIQCTLDLVTLLVSTKTVTKSDNVTKYIIFM